MITIEQRPQIFTPAFNPVVWVVSSDNSGEAGYRYTATINIMNKDGSTVDETIELEKSPMPTGYAYFDLQKILSGYLNYDFGNTEATESNPNFYKVYKITFSGEWDVDSETASITGSTVFFGVLTFEDFLTWDYTQYRIESGTGYKFFTNQPNNLPVINGAAGFLYFTSQQANSYNFIVYEAYNSAGTLLQKTIVDAERSGTFPDADYGWNRIPAGPANISLINSGIILSGAQPILPASTSYYKVYLTKPGANLLYNGDFVEADGGFVFVTATGVDLSLSPFTDVMVYDSSGDNTSAIVSATSDRPALAAGIYDLRFNIQDFLTDFITSPFSLKIYIGTDFFELNDEDFITDVNGTYYGRIITTGGVPKITVQVDTSGSNYSFSLSYVYLMLSEAVTEQRTFIIDNNCSKFDTYIMHFLNKLGGFDTMYFNGKSIRNTTVNKSNYSQQINKLTGAEYGYSIDAREDTQFNTYYGHAYRLTSGWLSEAQALWMEEMLTSPVVFWQKTYAKNISVNITDTSFDTKIKNNEKLIFIEFTMSISIKEGRQSL